MKLVYDTDGRGLVELYKLQRKLSVLEGIVSRSGKAQTITAFGESMSPADVVARIVQDVAQKGDSALLKYTELLDKRKLRRDELRVDPDEIKNAAAEAPAVLMKALEKSRDNIARFQERIKAPEETKIDGGGGRKFVHRHMPLDRVGLYVPGGRAAYPSSVLMSAVPAQVAGVKRIAVTTPMADVHGARNVLAACHLVGIDEVYRIGGAQAIAALAFGTQSVPRVDLIAGPGNIFVTLAKREVFGVVGIDSLAGPSEVLIVSDASSQPAPIAADMIAQAEHDPAASVLITTDGEFGEAVIAEVDEQILDLTRGPLARASLDNYGLVIVVSDVERAVELANAFAPEHLQVITRGAETVASKITTAGAVFVGSNTPVPVGDYYAGPSHVLPTGGSARFFSGLSVNTFLRSASTMVYTAKALKEDFADIERIAVSEGLTAHGRAVDIRVHGKEGSIPTAPAKTTKKKAKKKTAKKKAKKKTKKKSAKTTVKKKSKKSSGGEGTP